VRHGVRTRGRPAAYRGRGARPGTPLSQLARRDDPADAGEQPRERRGAGRADRLCGLGAGRPRLAELRPDRRGAADDRGRSDPRGPVGQADRRLSD
ncbi:MAG: Urocanate hydratase, partial [uncultured Thermoleophilia bacterium]